MLCTSAITSIVKNTLQILISKNPDTKLFENINLYLYICEVMSFCPTVNIKWFKIRLKAIAVEIGLRKTCFHCCAAVHQLGFLDRFK